MASSFDLYLGLTLLPQFYSCYFKYNQQSLIAIMSSKSLQIVYPRRTSERHRLKMLQNLDEYKISNPYKAHKSIHCIPDELSEQLKRIDYLSSTTISMLKMEKQNAMGSDSQNFFAKMNQARKAQQDKFRQLFEPKEEKVNEDLEMGESDHIQQEMYIDERQPEEVITTREQVSLDFESIHNNLFYKEHEDELNLLESNFLENREHNQGFKEYEITIMDVQYEHYFLN